MSSLDKVQVLQRMSACGVVAVIRAPSKDLLPQITRALLSGGVISIEVTMSTPDAIRGIDLLAKQFASDALLGVGTVLDAKTAQDAIAAGARFVVSPTFDSQIVSTVNRANVLCIPGAFTPTEMLHAHRNGADVVKVFPSTALGPGYFKDVLAPLPFLKLMPTGGVDAANAGGWIKAGAVCVGVSSSLVTKDAMTRNDWNSITSNAKDFIRSVQDARSSK
jgi:2-dehydro-3-deoxyphosphogluconate aldolase/(4S)-4-hydroxy-2-oxoglutarate aldolase